MEKKNSIVEEHKEAIKAAISVSPKYLELYHDSNFTDIKLIIGDRSFLCHRIVLAACSEYFCAMFTSDFKEKNEVEVNLVEIDPVIASLVIKYIYGHELELTLMELSRVQAIYALALQWTIRELQKQCHDYFTAIMNAENCCQLASFADYYHAAKLCDEILVYIRENFFECIKVKSIKDLSYDLLIQLIQCDYLNVTDEDSLLESISIWIDSDISQKKRYLISLLSNLRLPYISPESLIAIEERYIDVIENSLEYLNMLRRVKNYSLIPENYFDKSAKPRMYIKNVDYCGVTSIHVTYAYEQQDCFNVYGIINKERYPLQRLDSSTFDDTSNINQIERVRLLTYAAVCVGHKIIVFGGVNEDKQALDSIVAFDVRKTEWTFPAWGFDLPEPLAYLAACIYKDDIYIMGGLNKNNQCSNKVWRLCRQNKTWEAVAPLNTARKCCQVVVVENFIYIGGGLDDNEDLITTFERYNPLLNTWNIVYELKTIHHSIRLIYARSKLFIYHSESTYDCYMQSADGKWYKASEREISECSREIHGIDYITDGYIAIDQKMNGYGFFIPRCK
ncbi:Kelch-like protein diablo [Trichoplax sp. H2]|nr:Kelch-like protein diablo [Trichoplax sp. H2]|eukprot:RDD38199.1 Kelch-like protein diablo [Trichoplax sp. H2]